MKYYKAVGLFACVLLVISCFLPWAWYPDLHTSFNGFYSEQGIYGKPAKLFIFFAVCCAFFILTNKVWAKRTCIFFAAFNIGYLIKSYVLFTSCYNTICPQKQYGLYLLIFSCALLMIVSVLPDMKLREEHGDSDMDNK